MKKGYLWVPTHDKPGPMKTQGGHRKEEAEADEKDLGNGNEKPAHDEMGLNNVKRFVAMVNVSLADIDPLEAIASLLVLFYVDAILPEVAPVRGDGREVLLQSLPKHDDSACVCGCGEWAYQIIELTANSLSGTLFVRLRQTKSRR